MLSKNLSYRRLKKLGGRGSFGSSYYWLGKDHLLLVEVSGYSEKYRRFFYRDIQAVVMEQTKRRLWFAIGLGLPALACLVVLFIAFTDMAPRSEPIEEYLLVGGFWVGLMLLFLVPMMFSFLRGPGAIVSIRTAVQIFKLPGITRWKRGELLVNELTPLVLAAQAATAATGSAAAVVSPAIGDASAVATPQPSPET